MTELLTLNEVKEITKLSRSTIYLQMSTSKFPCPIKIGQRRVAWKSSDIDDWMESLEKADYKA